MEGQTYKKRNCVPLVVTYNPNTNKIFIQYEFTIFVCTSRNNERGK